MRNYVCGLWHVMAKWQNTPDSEWMTTFWQPTQMAGNVTCHRSRSSILRLFRMGIGSHLYDI